MMGVCQTGNCREQVPRPEGRQMFFGKAMGLEVLKELCLRCIMVPLEHFKRGKGIIYKIVH